MAYLGVVVVGTAILVLILTWLYKLFSIRRILNKIPGPRTFGLLGNAHQMSTDPDVFFEQAVGVGMMYQQPRMCRFWLLCWPYVVIYGAKECEVVLSSSVHNEKSREYALLHPWMGQGMLTISAKNWRPRRKLLTPTFHYDILKDFVDIFSQEAQVLVGKLLPFAESGTPVDTYPYMTLCALDIICESAMGQHVGAQNNKHPDYVKSIYTINEIIHQRQKQFWFWLDSIFNMFGRGAEFQQALNVVHELTDKVIAERYAQIQAAGGLDNIVNNNAVSVGGKRRMAFLDLVLEMVDKKQLTLVDAKDEVTTFMFAGHDTTSTAMNWTLMLLGTHPRCQQLVNEELDSIFGDDPRQPTNEDLNQMKYLECCVKEALRLYPSVPMLARQLTTDIEMQGHKLPAGITVLMNPYMVHREPEHWPDPEMYIPERFLPENSAGRHPYAYLPFSAGARNCLGQRFAFMETKTVLSWLLRYFSVTSTLRRDQVRVKGELILRSVHGVPLKLAIRRDPPAGLRKVAKTNNFQQTQEELSKPRKIGN